MSNSNTASSVRTSSAMSAELEAQKRATNEAYIFNLEELRAKNEEERELRRKEKNKKRRQDLLHPVVRPHAGKGLSQIEIALLYLDDSDIRKKMCFLLLSVFFCFLFTTSQNIK